MSASSRLTREGAALRKYALDILKLWIDESYWAIRGAKGTKSTRSTKSTKSAKRAKGAKR